MGISELKSQLYKMLDKIEDEQLLRSIHSFLNERENSQEGRLWSSLTEEQRKEVLQAFDESEDESNLIDDADVWKEVSWN